MSMTTDKQLRGIMLHAVLEKRRVGQALNLKEFAVLAGVSYSVAREWVHPPGFPRFQGVVCWEDFIEWRRQQTKVTPASQSTPQAGLPSPTRNQPSIFAGLPPRAAQILMDSATSVSRSTVNRESTCRSTGLRRSDGGTFSRAKKTPRPEASPLSQTKFSPL